MPRVKSLKTLCVETILFIGLFAVVGHLTFNLWERFIIQTELSKMKYSLHSLKDTITNIGTAYDNLHKELKGLVKIAEKKSSISIGDKQKIEQQQKYCKSKNTLDRRTRHDLQVQALIKANEMKLGIPFALNETMEDYFKGKEKIKPIKSEATTTRDTKSTGVGSDDTYYYKVSECSDKGRCKYKYKSNKNDRKNNNLDYEWCDDDSCSRWKF